MAYSSMEMYFEEENASDDGSVHGQTQNMEDATKLTEHKHHEEDSILETGPQIGHQNNFIREEKT